VSPGTMKDIGATAPKGKIPCGHIPHRYFSKIYAAVTKIHRPSSTYINFYVEYRNKIQINLISRLFLIINIQ
jgi:hypothetical protein